MMNAWIWSHTDLLSELIPYRIQILRFERVRGGPLFQPAFVELIVV